MNLVWIKRDKDKRVPHLQHCHHVSLRGIYKKAVHLISCNQGTAFPSYTTYTTTKSVLGCLTTEYVHQVFFNWENPTPRFKELFVMWVGFWRKKRAIFSEYVCTCQQNGTHKHFWHIFQGYAQCIPHSMRSFRSLNVELRFLESLQSQILFLPLSTDFTRYFHTSRCD